MKQPLTIKVIEGVYPVKVKGKISGQGDRSMVQMVNGTTKHIHRVDGEWYACVSTFANQREVQRVEFA